MQLGNKECNNQKNCLYLSFPDENIKYQIIYLKKYSTEENGISFLASNKIKVSKEQMGEFKI